VTDDNARNWIVASSEEVGYESLKGMFANFISCCQAIFIVTVPGMIPFAIIMAEDWLNFVINTKTKAWFDTKNSPQQQKQFVFFVLQRFDHMLSMMAKAGQNHATNMAVKANNVDGVDVEGYDEAMRMAVEDLADAKKWVSRSNPCKVDITCLPVQKSPTKKQRVEQQQQPQQLAQRPSPAFGGAPRGGHRQGVVVEGQAWGAGANDDWNRSRLATAAERKKKGDLIVKRGCNNPLAPSVKDIYCTDFAVVGCACMKTEGGDKCTKKHFGMHRWEPEHRNAQIEHVDRNRNYVMFNAASVKFLPANKMYLLGTKDGPVGERA
jgi:hypothetical protein